MSVANLRVLGPSRHAVSRWRTRIVRVEWGRTAGDHPNNHRHKLTIALVPRLFSRGVRERGRFELTVLGLHVSYVNRRPEARSA